MLHLRKDRVYVIDNDVSTIVLPNKEKNPKIPKIDKTSCYKSKYHQWLNRYENDIEDMWNTLIDYLMDMKQSDRFVCHYDLKHMKDNFTKLAYSTSDSTYKGFI